MLVCGESCAMLIYKGSNLKLYRGVVSPRPHWMIMPVVPMKIIFYSGISYTSVTDYFFKLIMRYYIVCKIAITLSENNNIAKLVNYPSAVIDWYNGRQSLLF